MSPTNCANKVETLNINSLVKFINGLMVGLDRQFVDHENLVHKAQQVMTDRMSVSQTMNLLAEMAASMCTNHPDYGLLAGRILTADLHYNTESSWLRVVQKMYDRALVSEKLYQIVQNGGNIFDANINHKNDYSFNYFGLKTLMHSYLLKIDNLIVERPQHMWMRVAVSIHEHDTVAALETYAMLSAGLYIHGSPTLFNAMTNRPHLSSCFLVGLENNSTDGIFNTLKQCAQISNFSGGVGLHVHNFCNINTSTHLSKGIAPLLKIFNETARFVDQGNKRPGAFAVYLEPWHPDIVEFLNLKKNTGKEEFRARELFYALWIPSEFMRRVYDDKMWSLMCPLRCPGLSDCWGAEFDKLYERYESQKMFETQIKARQLWFVILTAQIETGMPYMLYKDSVNSKSNQQHLGTIKSSNLCAEIVQYSSSEETAVCNLASVVLRKFVRGNQFDFAWLKSVVKNVTHNVNLIIDRTEYPDGRAEYSNKKHRPIAIGVQGLADTFLELKLPFDSPEARLLNMKIFETIYYGALESSCLLAAQFGPHESFDDSPVSKGLLQFDMWESSEMSTNLSEPLWDWASLREDIRRYGLRNSLLVACMPTASTAQILGNSESCEPHTSNLYLRRVLSGEFQIINKYLVRDLISLNLWTPDIKNKILASGGSVQQIDEIPDKYKYLYRTVWEIPQRSLLDMAAERGPYVDQSQSTNIYMTDCTFDKLTSMHFHAWRIGLKTGMYYLRTKPAAEPIKYTVEESPCSFCTA